MFQRLPSFLYKCRLQVSWWAMEQEAAIALVSSYSSNWLVDTMIASFKQSCKTLENNEEKMLSSGNRILRRLTKPRDGQNQVLRHLPIHLSPGIGGMIVPEKRYTDDVQGEQDAWVSLLKRLDVVVVRVLAVLGVIVETVV